MYILVTNFAKTCYQYSTHTHYLAVEATLTKQVMTYLLL